MATKRKFHHQRGFGALSASQARRAAQPRAAAPRRRHATMQRWGMSPNPHDTLQHDQLHLLPDGCRYDNLG